MSASDVEGLIFTLWVTGGLLGLVGVGLFMVFMCAGIAFSSGAKPAPAAEVSPDDEVEMVCLKAGVSACSLDTFVFDGRRCVRWHKGDGSGMECWLLEEEK